MRRDCEGEGVNGRKWAMRELHVGRTMMKAGRNWGWARRAERGLRWRVKERPAGGRKTSSSANNTPRGGGSISSLPVDSWVGVGSGEVDKLIRRRVCAKSSRCKRETTETIFERVRPNFPVVLSPVHASDRSEIIAEFYP